MSIKQDRIGTRTSEDLRRRLNIRKIDETIKESENREEDLTEINNRVNNISRSLNNTRTNYVSTQSQSFTESQKAQARTNIGAGNSSFSGSYDDLENKPTSLSDINTTESNKLKNIESNAQVNVLEKIYIAGEELTPTNKAVNIYIDSSMSDYSENPVQNKAIKQYIDDNLSPATTYFASSYAESGVSILRSSIEVKNNRVCFNFVGTKSMSANSTTTLFTLPSQLRPIETRDFVVFGQSSNTDGYVGYGYVTPDGLLQVRFNEAISSYIRFSATYDLY